jgi:hypothetical protein
MKSFRSMLEIQTSAKQAIASRARGERARCVLSGLVSKLAPARRKDFQLLRHAVI